MRQCSERSFETIDGASLFYRHWPAEAANAGERAIVLLHRGHEHSGRLQHLVDELDLPECSMFAWDARGHGRSSGRRGCAPSFATLIKDLDTFVRHLESGHGTRPSNIVVVAQSVGSVLAAAWVHDYAPKIRAMVLAAPAFQIKLYVPFARPALKILHKIFGDFTVKSYVRPDYLTHDPQRIASFRSDPLITRDISAKVLLDVYNTAARVLTDAQAIQAPTQVLVSGADWVVHKKPQRRFFERLGSPIKEKHELSGFYHDTFGEKDRRLAIGNARRFIQESFERPLPAHSMLDADRRGPTKEEFDQLSRPLSPVSPRGMTFRVIRAGIKTGGRLSDGIRLGLLTGFDSGSTLDYVYRNQASGITPAGRVVDWLYLNSIGWRGIRIRKQHLERLIGSAAHQLRAGGMPVNIVDIAAGHGRYVLDCIQKNGARADQVLFRDYSEFNIRQGTALIQQRGLQAIARFEKGDAFDGQSLASLTPRPTLGVVSGLYELFPGNDAVRQSLAGLARAIPSSGYIVYTGQPWHPQLEFIARALSSHREHRPWVMRRRTQAEMDELVEAAGFRKTDQLTDEWGIFTVSLAQRVAA